MWEKSEFWPSDFFRSSIYEERKITKLFVNTYEKYQTFGMLKKRISRGTLAGFWLCLLLTLILWKSFLFFFSFSILDETKQIDCESWIKIHCLLQEYTVFQSQQDYLKIHGSRMNPQNCKNEQDRSNPSPLIKKKKKNQVLAWNMHRYGTERAEGSE